MSQSLWAVGCLNCGLHFKFALCRKWINCGEGLRNADTTDELDAAPVDGIFNFDKVLTYLNEVQPFFFRHDDEIFRDKGGI